MSRTKKFFVFDLVCLIGARIYGEIDLLLGMAIGLAFWTYTHRGELEDDTR